MLIIFLFLFSFVSAAPRRYNYNCFSVYAELFPIIKTPFIVNRSYVFSGKDYDELQENIPKYLQKVKEIESTLEPIPEDPDAYKVELYYYSEGLRTRTENPDFDEPPEVDFRNRMKYRKYYQNLPKGAHEIFDPWVRNDPIDWLDIRNVVYRYIRKSISLNYDQMNRLRPSKMISKTDYCTQLAASLSDDPDWKQGAAKNARELVFRCYDTFPYSNDAAKKVFDLGLLMAEFYVFSNYSTNGGGTGMIFKEFKDQKLQFDSSLHFHDYFGRTIGKMNDAHISYSINCYEQFSFVQPVYIEYYDQKMYIKKVNSLKLQEWVGAQIMYIDSLDAITSVTNYVDVLGKSHHKLHRINLGFSRLYFDSSSQDYLLDRGLYLKRSTIPYRNHVVYTLKKPGDELKFEVKVDWLVFKNPTVKEFNDQYSYWDNNCEAKPLKRIVKTSTTSLQRRNSGVLIPHASNIKRRSRNLQLQKRSDATTYKATVDGTVPITVGPGFVFFILNDSKYGDYGVLVIQTFNVADTDAWFRNMRIGFTTLMDKGITRLLLDLTGNSGGMLCLAYSLLGVLSPSPTYPFPATEFSYGTRTLITNGLKRIATCVDEAKIKVSPFKLQSFTNLVTRSDFPDGSNWEFGSEIKPKFVNGYIYGYSKFSPFLMEKCVMKGTSLLADIKPKFETIMVVSDGLCGSSCAIVAGYLQQNGHFAIVLTLETDSSKLPNLYTFAGGQVVNINNVKDVAVRSSCFDMIPDILEQTHMSITYRAVFNMKDRRTPLEYFEMFTYPYQYTKSYADSFAARWKDFFPFAMETIESKTLYGGMYGDLVECEGTDLFC